MAWRGSGVRVPSAPPAPRSRAAPGAAGSGSLPSGRWHGGGQGSSPLSSTYTRVEGHLSAMAPTECPAAQDAEKKAGPTAGSGLGPGHDPVRLRGLVGVVAGVPGAPGELLSRLAAPSARRVLAACR